MAVERARLSHAARQPDPHQGASRPSRTSSTRRSSPRPWAASSNTSSPASTPRGRLSCIVGCRPWARCSSPSSSSSSATAAELRAARLRASTRPRRRKITEALDKAGRRLRAAQQRHRDRRREGQGRRRALALAETGLPGNAQPGFELFDKQKLGASDFQQKVTYQRALEGEIARTIERRRRRRRRAGPARAARRRSSSRTRQQPATRGRAAVTATATASSPARCAASPRSSPRASRA